VTDDPARSGAVTPEPEPIPLEDPEPVPAPYVQITAVEATPLDAADMLERRDAYGRVPVVVRVRRQPPIRVEWILVAIALGASGLFLPLFLALKAVVIVAALAAVFLGVVSRFFIRVPPGSVGLVVVNGKPAGVLDAGIHRVRPVKALTHLVTSRDIAFDVPVSEARSADGVAVTVDLMLTLHVADPTRFAWAVATGDADALVHAAAQDAVRSLVRGTDSLAALDFGPAQASALRATIDAALDGYGIAVRGVAFTRVTLPQAITASLEARRLAAVRLAEAADAFALDQRRIGDQASLVAQEAEARRAAVEHEATAEALRLARLEERLAANPAAARYDLELARIRVAERLAGNARAVVSLGGPDLVGGLLLAGEATAAAAPAGAPAEPARAANGAAPPEGAASPASPERVARRRSPG
jgi:regulator of protease activity HflC (stomatin/prohibitin superfamily)